MTSSTTIGEHPASEDWAGARGTKWLAQLAQMEAMLAPIDLPLIDLLALSGARRIADLACGGGGTTLAVAAAADPQAAVFGYDISAALVTRAQERVAGLSHAPLFAVGDSATLAVDRPFDRVVSRFGTMFFPDPAAAFANIARLLEPGGRFAFAVWGSPADNRWMAIVRETVGKLVDIAPPPVDAPGPMRYGDVGLLSGLLAEAGFHDIAVTDWRDTLAVGGNLAPDAAARFVIEGMSVAQALGDKDPGLVDRAAGLLTRQFETHWRDGAVRLPAQVHLVSGVR